MDIEVEGESVPDYERMELRSGVGVGEVGAGLEEEGEGEGVGGEVGCAEVEHLVVEEDGMVRGGGMGVVLHEGVPDGDAGFGHVAAVDGGGDEVGVDLGGWVSLRAAAVVEEEGEEVAVVMVGRESRGRGKGFFEFERGGGQRGF